MSPDGQSSGLQDAGRLSHRDDDIEDLIAVLDRVPLTSNAMTLRELDGFLTGVLLTPSKIPLKEWLPLAWDERDVVAQDDPGLARQVTKALRRHHKRISRGLRTTDPVFEPLIFKHPVTEEAFWDPWVWGFDDALSLRPDYWAAVKSNPEAPGHAALMHFETLLDIAMGQSKLPDIAMELISAEAPELIRDFVLQLNAARGAPLRLTQPGAEKSPEPRLKKRKRIRRNDPCPCGSGKRYKRCCGAV